MKLFITGAEGMLGRALMNYGFGPGLMYGANHAAIDITDISGVRSWLQFTHAAPGDILINAAGRRYAPGLRDIDLMLSNTIGPHALAEATASLGMRMIHVSTDCVFSGPHAPKKGWEPSSLAAPDTAYGRSKLAGEVDAPHVLNVRTSFVGPAHGLWRWVAEHPPGEISCWKNALWSGSHVDEVAGKIIEDIVPIAAIECGTIHLASPIARTKAGMVRTIASHLGRTDLDFVDVKHPRIDRRLRPDVELVPLDLVLLDMAWVS